MCLGDIGLGVGLEYPCVGCGYGIPERHAHSIGAETDCRIRTVAVDDNRDDNRTHTAQLKAILLAWGMPEDNAEATADVLSWADLHGVDSHGISMIPGYDRLRRSGRAKMDVRAEIVKQTPVSALVET